MLIRVSLCLALLGLAACSYQIEQPSPQVPAPFMAYTNRVPGKWLLLVDASAITANLGISQPRCDRFDYSMDFSRAFAKVAGPDALRPKDYFEQDWTSEEFTRGGPTSVPGTGVLTSFGEWRDRPFGRVHWAGAEHADYWTGYMDGAVRSGRHTANAVLEQED